MTSSVPVPVDLLEGPWAVTFTPSACSTVLPPIPALKESICDLFWVLVLCTWVTLLEIFPFANESYTQNIESQKPVPLHHSQSYKDTLQNPETVCHRPGHFTFYTWQPYQAWVSTASHPLPVWLPWLLPGNSQSGGSRGWGQRQLLPPLSWGCHCVHTLPQPHTLRYSPVQFLPLGALALSSAECCVSTRKRHIPCADLWLFPDSFPSRLLSGM